MKPGVLILFLFLLVSCERRQETPGSFWLKDAREAFARSARSGKPLFLYFSARWCSWCRVYEEVLGSEEVRSALSLHFTPLLLDADRNRDLFVRFGGRGTPFTVVLDPRGKVLFRFHGAVGEEDLLGILNLILEGGVTVSPEGETVVLEGIDRETYRELLERFLLDLEVRYDPLLGGFSSPSLGGSSFKWTTPLTYTFLLEKGKLVEEVLFSLRKDLELLYDEVDGGFFNFYDRTRAFDFYFETSKSLSVNALMLTALLRAYETTADPLFLEKALGTYRYLRKVLYHRESGCFLNAQISDPSYYALPPPKRKLRTPPPPDTALIVEYNAKAIYALLELHRFLGDEGILKTASRCLKFIETRLRGEEGIYRYYDVESGSRGVLNFERDVAFLSLALLRMGREREALELLESAEGWEDPVARGTALFVLSRLDRRKALRLLKGTRVNLHYQNPDDLVFLLKALERLVNG